MRANEFSEARGLAPTKPYDDLMANMGYFMSLNTVKLQQDAVDSNAQQELANMQQQFRKPILNGMSFFDVNRDIKLSLLMIFSASFIVFVLPETILNIYKSSFSEDLQQENRPTYLLDIFFLLKITHYSSNYLAYLTLITFGKIKIKKNIF